MIPDIVSNSTTPKTKPSGVTLEAEKPFKVSVKLKHNIYTKRYYFLQHQAY